MEAVAPVGQHFVEWSDKNSDNPRVYQVTGDVEIYPIYAPKDEYPACTLAKSSEYNGMAQTVEVKGSDTSCVISFYQNEEDCNAEVNKVPLKNPGTYYVRVDRRKIKLINLIRRCLLMRLLWVHLRLHGLRLPIYCPVKTIRVCFTRRSRRYRSRNIRLERSG